LITLKKKLHRPKDEKEMGLIKWRSDWS
jgi:hypothetical protein